MRILVIGDLHGRKPIINNKNFDAIVLVGDICDDRDIAPLYKEFFRLLKKIDDDSFNFDKFIIEKLGSEKKLEKYERKSLKRGAEILKYLDSFNKPIFMVAGNWDQSYGKTRIKDKNQNRYNYLKFFYDSWLGDQINPKLTKGLKNLKDCMFHCHDFCGINFIGYGLSSAPEKLSLRKKSKRTNGSLSNEKIETLKKANEKIIQRLENVYKNRNKKYPTFFITHNIPYNTKLDLITDKKSYAYKKHLGSTVARKFCSKFQPVICAGGHIHDCPGRDKIGKTLIINPGYGNRAQVIIDFDEKKGKIKKVRFLK